MVGEWLKANWRPVGAVLLLVGTWALSKFPGLDAERELLASIGWTLGVVGTAFVPSFAKTKDP